jgi:hypothetical protein
MDVTRQSHRYQVVQQRNFHVCVIPFKTLQCSVMVAHVVDISKNGVGVEAVQRLEPGFVWFKDRIMGFKGGLLLWSRQTGEKYRAGIRFVPLSHDKERLVQDQIDAIRPLQPLPNPEVIVSTILEAMTQNQPEGRQSPAQSDPADLTALRTADDAPTEEDLIAQLRSMLSSL